MKKPDDPFRARLAALKPARRGQDPSPARLRIREAFRDITAARERRVTWEQITELLTAEGIRRPTDGGPLTVNEVRALYHAERALIAARDARKGGKDLAKPPSPPPQPSVPRPPQATEDPAKPQPAPANPANPWAEVERQTAEAKARREEAERSKDWNPYAIPKEKPE